MALLNDPGKDLTATLLCAKTGEHRVRFNSMKGAYPAGVLVQVGPCSAIIAREEVAALAALFPVDKQQSR